MFKKPSSGNFLQTTEVVNHLLYIPKVLEVSQLPDRFNGGTKTVVKAIVVDLDGDAEPTETLVGQANLTGDIAAPGPVNFLGRVVEKDTGKPKPAIVWGSPTPDDEAKALAWIEKRKSTGAFSQPAPAPAQQPDGDAQLQALLDSLT